MKKPYKRAVALFLAMVMLAVSVPLLGAARSETDPYQFVHDTEYIYWYRSPHRYSYTYEGEYHYPYVPAMYHVIYNNESLATYCCDLVTSVVEGTAYKRVNLEDSAYYSDENAAHIRGVLNNGYWVGFTSSDLVNLAQKAGITDTLSLTAAEALAATQTAIWTFANNGVLNDIYYGTRTITSTGDIKDPITVNVAEGGKSYTTEITKTNSNIQKVYDYLIQQKDGSPKSIVWSFDDDISVLTSKDSNACDVTVKFKINGTDDAVNINLYADLFSGTAAVASESLVFTESSVPEKDEAGYYTVTFEDVAASALQNSSVKLSFSGTQTLANDVYFYDPEGGRNAAQSFVGIGGGSTPVSDEITKAFTVGTQALSVYAYDADAGENAADYPMSGVEFELYVSVDGAEAELYPGSSSKTTDENGVITWDGLTDADNIKYYYKQVSSADGYEVLSDQLKEFGSDGNASAANTRKQADLTIANTVKGADLHFDYIVELDLSASDLNSNDFDWLDLSGEYSSVTAEYSNDCGDASAHPAALQFTENENGLLVAAISLSNGESVILKNLPVGAVYSVVETDNDGHEMNDNIITSVSSGLYSCEDAAQSGVVSADGQGSNALQFKNTEYASDSIVISGEVYLDGVLTRDKFSYQLTDISAETPTDIETVQNSENGSIVFTALNYSKPGTYKYEVRQTSTDAGYELDDSVYTVAVEVTKDEENSKLVASEPVITKNGVAAEKIVFSNYSSNLLVTAKAVWILDDGGSKPASVNVTLFKDGAEYAAETLSDANNWECSWENLRNGSTWTVEASAAPEGFTLTSEDNGLNFVFTYNDVAKVPEQSETTTASGSNTTTSVINTTETTSEGESASVTTAPEASIATTAKSETSTTESAATTRKETTTSKVETTALHGDVSEDSEEKTTKKESSKTSTTTQKAASETSKKTTAATQQADKDGGSAESAVPDTGSDNAVIIVMAVFVLAGAALFAVSKKKKVTE